MHRVVAASPPQRVGAVAVSVSIPLHQICNIIIIISILFIIIIIIIIIIINSYHQLSNK